MAKKPRIRPIALAVVRRGGELLLETGFDSVKRTWFARPPGGGIEFGESAADAVKRELAEEFGLMLLEPTVLGVLENIFVYEGAPGHEICYVFEGRFAEVWPYESATVAGQEGKRHFKAAWFDPMEILRRGWPLHPDGMVELLGLTANGSPPEAG